jgi:hypothetical protein
MSFSLKLKPQAQASSVTKLHQWLAFPNKTCQASERTFVLQALKSVYHAALVGR